MVLKIKLLIVFLILSFTAFSQGLKPGFDKEEYLEALKISAITSKDSSYFEKIEAPSKFQMIYQSEIMGLDNFWDLWQHQSQNVAAISIRGTTPNPISWLENFYAAMVPATGKLDIQEGFAFDYALADNPRAAVHIGWLVGTAFLSRDMLPKMDSLYQSGTKEFLIIGHSQGGGIAYLLTAHFRSLQRQGNIPQDLKFKTYCSAAPKPGNLYFAYAYEHMDYDGWAYNVVNAKDWVPEVPMSIQTTGDFNDINPFQNAKVMISKQKFPKNLALKRVYNQLDKPTRKAQKNYQKYLGEMASKAVSKNIEGFNSPEYYGSNHYVRTGKTIVLTPDSDYEKAFPDDVGHLFPHHLHPAYLLLTEKLP
ncbi:lipase family protein [Pararhodonellum marinum]|uniref:lipase family protein n=1 Tax=Pararhodonellum marinum TaxID=2755358 RepID=UPI00188E72D7|nr:lipase family protein [Pararhodonellum marinum]